MVYVKGKAILNQRDFDNVKSWIKENIPKHTHGKTHTVLIKNKLIPSSHWVSYRAIIYFERKEDAALFRLFWNDEICN